MKNLMGRRNISRREAADLLFSLHCDRIIYQGHEYKAGAERLARIIRLRDLASTPFQSM